MYNYFMLMGRLVKDPEIYSLEDGKQVMNITIAVKRNFKNSDGNYDVDFFRIAFWEFLVDMYKDYLKKGMPIVVKGRLQIVTNKLESGYEAQSPTLIGERIMFFEYKKYGQEMEN